MKTNTFSKKSNTFPTLFPVEVNTTFGDILHEGFSLLNKDPDILNKIEYDLDCYAMKKQAKRLADKAWLDRQTLPLGLELQEIVDSFKKEENDAEDDTEENSESEKEIKISLGFGRPRMKPEAVFLFMLFRGYFESVTDVRATDRIVDSITVSNFFQNYGCGNLPKRSTIHDNIQAVSYETRTYIYRSQLVDVKDRGIDDYKRLTLDSTAVMANSRWPVDSGVICRLLERAFKNSQSLSKYGVPNFMPWHTALWLSKISQLNFKISVTSGKGAKVKRRGLYRTLYTEAEKIITHLRRENQKHKAIMEMVDLPPSLAERLTQIRALIKNDMDDAEKVIGYSRRRILNGEKIPNSEKIMSLSDGSAAFIVKGNRETVLGYRPQVGRSGNGFVTVLYVPEGNAADSPQLVSLVEDAIENTGIVSNIVSVDDGYSSTQGIGSTRMIPGVDVVSASGAKGKKIISAEDWNSESYIEARRNRSSVESIMFTLKYVYGFGNLRRRGIDAVRIELLEKAIVHNLSRLAALKKKRRQQAA